jgi:hypothetical protein
MPYSTPVTRRVFVQVGTIAAGALLTATPGFHAQMSGFAAKPLLQSTVAHDQDKETVLLAITIAAGGSSRMQRLP